MAFDKQLKYKLSKINIQMIGNLIEINTQDKVAQVLKHINFVSDSLNENEDEIIGMEIEEKYKEELCNFKDGHDAFLMLKYFYTMKI
jgi:hypothetical protein